MLAKYTTQVRSICEYYAGLSESGNYADIDSIISTAIPSIFTSGWPIYDESRREELETKILKHYYFQEIGFETVALWKFYLNTTLAEIMPYYNQLYSTVGLVENPLDTIAYTEQKTGSENTTEAETTTGSVSANESGTAERTENRNGTSETSVDSTESRDNTEKYSDTPQGGLTGIANNTYLTDVTMQDGTTTTDSSTNTTSEDTITRSDSDSRDRSETTSNVSNRNEDKDSNFTTTWTGRNGQSVGKLLEEYRAQILNIDMQIINDLQNLFMQVW